MAVEWHHNDRRKVYVYDYYPKYTSELIYIGQPRVMCFGIQHVARTLPEPLLPGCDFSVVFPKYGSMDFEAKKIYHVE